MKAVQHGKYDYTFFIDTLELERLKESSLEGKLWNREFPYDCFEKKVVILRPATDDDRCYCGGAGSDFEKKGFWIVKSVYDRILENGHCIGIIYDGGGNRIDIINYEVESKSDDPWYESLMEDLKLIYSER